MSQIKELQTTVHVTIATLNKPGSFFTSDTGHGFVMFGHRIAMGSAVFSGKVLDTKVTARTN